MPKFDGKKYKYNRKGMIAYLKAKRKKKRGRNGDKYGQIPTSSLGGDLENPVGGN